MLADKLHTGDAAYIAEEMVGDASFALRSKCLSVYGVVGDKIVALDKALELYKVPYDVYLDFLAKKQAEEVEDQSGHDSVKETMIFRIHLYEKILSRAFSAMDAAHIGRMLRVLKKYSKEIEEDKLSLKE